MNKRVFNIMAIALLCLGYSLKGNAQVTYFDTNNFLLYYFTNTGSSAYDWRFEPQKTDYERGQLKGNPTKIVTNITDNTGRGFGTHFTDTTYYNAQGNITKVVALKKDEFNPNNKFRPDLYTYQYNAQGQLTNWTKFSETDNMDGHHMTKHVHDIVRDNQGRTTKEIYRAYTLKGEKWEDFTTGDGVNYTLSYDANGNLTSGKMFYPTYDLTYKNGQLVKMLAEGFNKPVTYTYDPQGRMTAFKYFSIDGMDIEEYYETSVTLTYNEKGYISKAVKTTWICTNKWVRRRAIETNTYTMTYTYDPQGNWTKAVVNSKTGKQASQKAFVIERSIEYGESLNKPIADKKGIIHPTFMGIPLD